MNSQDFIRLSQKQVSQINNYITNQAPVMVTAKVYRFIDGNFRAQGWQGASFVAWKKNNRNGTILIKTGALRRSMNHANAGPGAVKFYSNLKYAGIHNRGGTITGNAQVKAHERRRFIRDEVSAPGARKEKWVKTQTGISKVRAHTRSLNITMPQRQFAPYEGSESPVMNNAITRELERDILKILNT